MIRLKYILDDCLLAAAMSLMFLGCSEIMSQEAEPTGPDSGQEDFMFNAYIDSNPETRTAMGELGESKYPVLWSENDSILVLDQSKNKYRATLLDGAGTNKAVFKGRFWGAKWRNAQHFTSVYPSAEAALSVKSYSIRTNSDGSKYYPREITATNVLPSVQDYCENTFANDVFPMIGHCFNLYDFYYENMAGVLQLPVKGEGKISKIILTGNNDEQIAGKFTVGFAYWYWSTKPSGVTESVTIKYLEDEIAESEKDACDGRKIEVVSGESTGMITIDCGSDGLQLNPTTPTMINIVMLPKTFTKGFSVRFIDYDNGGSFEKSTSQSITVKRSYVKTMKEFDYQTPEPLETANCYVVDKAGYYMIPAFCMGNRPKSARLSVDENGINTATGNTVEADYLWTDVEGAVTQIEYIPGKDGYISFKVNADASGNAPRGNTVVALYDSVTKEILWSWHIWMSEYNEVWTNGSCREGESTADGFTSDEANKSLLIMDRNLGAVSADKNDGWKTYGLYYQMGRKDPFIGAKTAGGDSESLGVYSDKNHMDDNLKEYNNFETTAFGESTNDTKWNTNLTTGWNYVKNFITAQYGYQHPMDFASSWDKNTDTRWTTKELNTTEPFVSNGKHEDFWNRSKTINDPCPAGWTVLGENGKLSQTPSSSVQYTSGGVYGIEAVYTSKDGSTSSTVWWPASGFRSVDGTLGNIGLGGYYWWFDHIGATHGGHGWWFYKNGTTFKEDSGVMTNHASSVRCVKAKQS